MLGGFFQRPFHSPSTGKVHAFVNSWIFENVLTTIESFQLAALQKYILKHLGPIQPFEIENFDIRKVEGDIHKIAWPCTVSSGFIWIVWTKIFKFFHFKKFCSDGVSRTLLPLSKSEVVSYRLNQCCLLQLWFFKSKC